MVKSTRILLSCLLLLMIAFSGTAYAASNYDSYSTHVYNYASDGTLWANIYVNGSVYGSSGAQDVYVTGSMSGTYNGGSSSATPISLQYTGYTSGSTLSWYEARCSAGTNYDCANIQTGSSYVRFIAPEDDTVFYVGFDGSSLLDTMQVNIDNQLIGEYSICKSYNCDISDSDSATVSY